MKFVVLTLFTLLSVESMANTRWNSLVKGSTYKLDRKLTFVLQDGSEFTLSKSEKFKLVEVETLDKIKVNLHKFKSRLNRKECKYITKKSDLQILNLKDERSKSTHSAGLTIAKDCYLEVFVDKKDYYSRSIFK